MKKAIALVAVTFVFLFTFYTLVFAQNSEAQGEVKPLARPYFVEVIAPNGDTREIRGSSLNYDPFLIAKDLGIDVIEKDHFKAFPDPKMDMGSKITVWQTPSFTINDGKKHLSVRSWAKTVGELLAENDLELGVDDKINFSPDTKISFDDTITIIRVARTIVFESQAIDYNIKKADDPTMDKGKTKVKQAGVKGEKKLTFEVIREDGVQISKTLKKTETVSEPVDEILLVGTKPVITVACRFNDTVIEAALKYNLDPNGLCVRMMKESRGNPNSDGGDYKGLFQYESGFWADASKKAGYSGASIWDAKAQIFTTAWAWSHGYRGRWPSD